jgi:hypothetical protein
VALRQSRAHGHMGAVGRRGARSACASSAGQVLLKLGEEVD